MKILLINGPNLQLLGIRESHFYGSNTLNSIIQNLQKIASAMTINLDTRQSNHEGEIIDWIGAAHLVIDGILINPGAFAHTSFPIRDAIAAVMIPSVEIHISNIYSREDFRQCSLIAPVCIAQLVGFGSDAYEWALRGLVQYLQNNKSSNKLLD